jgi:hypothetical protein
MTEVAVVDDRKSAADDKKAAVIQPAASGEKLI